MAQIKRESIKRIDKNRNTIHDKVHAIYTVFVSGGKKYFQIDTYGRVDREMPEKVSQSIQLDADFAQFLVDALREEFGIK